MNDIVKWSVYYSLKSDYNDETITSRQTYQMTKKAKNQTVNLMIWNIAVIRDNRKKSILFHFDPFFPFQFNWREKVRWNEIWIQLQ